MLEPHPEQDWISQRTGKWGAIMRKMLRIPKATLSQGSWQSWQQGRVDREGLVREWRSGKGKGCSEG